jgi:hypothetical protein
VAHYFTAWGRTYIMTSVRRCFGVPDLLRVPSAWVQPTLFSFNLTVCVLLLYHDPCFSAAVSTGTSCFTMKWFSFHTGSRSRHVRDFA